MAGKRTANVAAGAASVPKEHPIKKLKNGAKRLSEGTKQETPTAPSHEDIEREKEEDERTDTPVTKKGNDDELSTGKGQDNFFEELVSKADRSTFLVMAKRSKDPNVQQALAEYQALDRFDERKSNIIALWKKDKGCQWWNGWHKQQVEGEAVKMDDFAGYGTKQPSRICLIFLCFFVMILHLCSSGTTSHTCCTCRMTHLRCLSSWRLLIQMMSGTNRTALKRVTNLLVSSGTCFRSWPHTSSTQRLSPIKRLCSPSLTKKKATLLSMKLARFPRRSSTAR